MILIVLVGPMPLQSHHIYYEDSMPLLWIQILGYLEAKMNSELLNSLSSTGERVEVSGRAGNLGMI